MAAKKPPKQPKNIKLPWNVPRCLAASSDGTFVVVGGENGGLARLDTETWTLVPWPNLKDHGSVNTLAISRDATRVAISVAGGYGNPSGVEIRDVQGATQLFIPSPSNVRASWSPNGELLVATVEASVDHPNAGLAFFDLGAQKLIDIDVGVVDSGIASFLNDETVLAFVRRTGVEFTDACRILKISRTGSVEDLGSTTFRDAYLESFPIGDGHTLVVGRNIGWQVVSDSSVEVIAQGPRCTGTAADGDGFVAFEGKAFKRYDARGQTRGEGAAKSRIEDAARARDVLLMLESGRIELVS